MEKIALHKMTRNRQKTDVIIIGAGPTGLLLANLLGNMNVSVIIVEKNKTTVNEPRAVSIDDESMRALQAANLSKEIEGILVRGYGSIYKGPRGDVFASVKPFDKEYGFDKRNAFQQPELEDILNKSLANYKNVNALFGFQMYEFTQKNELVFTTLKNTDGLEISIESKFMIGCDGAHSSVRKLLDINLKGGSFVEPWLIIDLCNTKNRCSHTEVFCNPKRSCITLPGPNGVRRYEFKLNSGEDPKKVIEEQFVRDLLQSVGPDRDEKIRRVKVYTFHARVAEKWRDKSVFLAGDAAHLTPPFAGQGMNSGLRDAHNLAWKLDEVLKNRSKLGILDSYESERTPHAWSMIDLAIKMGRIMMPKSRIQGFIIRNGFKLLGLYGPARDYFSQMKYKPKPRFLTGLIWPDNRSGKNTLIGRMIFQNLLEDFEGKLNLLDDILPDKPALIIFSRKPERAVCEKLLFDIGNEGASIIGITPEDTKAIKTMLPIFRDKSRHFSRKPYPYYLDYVLLLRRDRYIAASCKIENIDDMRPKIKTLTSAIEN